MKVSVKLERYSIKRLKGGAEGFWLSSKNRRNFLEYLHRQVERSRNTKSSNADLLGKLQKPQSGHLSSQNTMYTISTSELLAVGGRGLLNTYSGSLSMAIMVEYPEHAWEPWKFAKTPRRWWELLSKSFAARTDLSLAVARLYLDWLTESYGEKIKTDFVESKLPKSVRLQLKYFGGLSTLVHSLDTNSTYLSAPVGQARTLIPWSTKPVVPTFWKNPNNVRAYFDFLRYQLGGSMEVLYTLTKTEILQTGGDTLLDQFGESVAGAVMAAYPEHQWCIWKFPRAPAHAWKVLGDQFKNRNEEAVKTVRMYIDELAKQLDIQSLNDWLNVRRAQLDAATLKRLDSLGRLPFILERLYPQHPWKRKHVQKLAQRQMIETVSKLVPHVSSKKLPKCQTVGS